MKKLMLLALLPLFFSCGDEDYTPPQPTKQQTIIGKWSLSEYATSKDYTKFMPSESEETLTFDRNTYTKTSQNGSISGKYTVDDVYLTLDEHWTYRINFDGSDIMFLREYGFGDANNVLKYRRMR